MSNQAAFAQSPLWDGQRSGSLEFSFQVIGADLTQSVTFKSQLTNKPYTEQSQQQSAPMAIGCETTFLPSTTAQSPPTPTMAQAPFLRAQAINILI